MSVCLAVTLFYLLLYGPTLPLNIDYKGLFLVEYGCTGCCCCSTGADCS